MNHFLDQFADRPFTRKCAPGFFYAEYPPTEEAYLLSSIQSEIGDNPQAGIDEILHEINQDAPQLSGTMVHLPMKTGSGWFYFDHPLQDDPIAQRVLPRLASHAAQAFKHTP